MMNAEASLSDREPIDAPAKYRIQHSLGSGQTSNVYLANHPTYGEVALKLPRSDARDVTALRRMFENEVVLTLRVRHPHVVQGLDGRSTGLHAYLALEMCHGGTLDQYLLERGRLPLEEAVRLVEDVAEGLANLHAQRILHRDVKPANVFLTRNGRAKLGDLGTGAMLGERNQERVGTAFYMAPEIFQGHAASVRSDVYSLGILAFEVLTGSRPFQGETFDALMDQHLSGLLVDPRARREDLPDAVAHVVRRALARDAARRPESVRAFLADLREAAPALTRGSEESQDRGPRIGRASRNGRVEDGQGDDAHEESSERQGAGSRKPWWKRGF